MAQSKTPTKPAEKEDVLGILSVVASFSGFGLIGLVLGLVGASKAKKENRSVALSRTGWIAGLVLTVLGFFVLLIVIIAAIAAPSISERAREIERESRTRSGYTIEEN